LAFWLNSRKGAKEKSVYSTHLALLQLGVEGSLLLVEELPVCRLFRKENKVSQPRKQHRVFVVDDEQVIASTLAMILCNQGFDATSFTKPLEALQAARLEAPNLLISDVAMPLLSGIELASQVRKHCPECKVLLFSGQAATANLLETARTNGHNFEVLSKPIHPADLLTKIRNLTESAPPLLPAEHLQAWCQASKQWCSIGGRSANRP
jgi:DNA-binding NtrC family response regulator